MTNDKVNILIVDDLPDKILVLETILQELGENIVCVRSGPEALRQVLDNEFAVILLDVNMPIMDGYETAAMIRRRRKSAHTPIIFVTAYTDEMHTAQGYSLGAVDYVLSPVAPAILRTKVKVFVELFRMTQQVKRQADERVALAQEQAARGVAEENVRRSNALAEASKVLASSLDFETTIAGLLRLVVPQLGDLAAIALVHGSGEIHETNLTWMDGAGDTQMLALKGFTGLHTELADALESVLARGMPENLHHVGKGEPPVRLWHSDGTNGDLPHFELTSVLILPLVARQKTLGALALALGPSGRKFCPADQILAGEIAGRAATALDNARLYRDIREADRRKNEFLSMLAHELRNPLAPILTGVQVMRLRGLDSPELRQIRDMIERQVHHLARLVDDLLDISRITRDKVRLQIDRVHATDIVSRAVEVSRPLLEARKHELTVEVPAEPIPIHADPLRLAQVLSNLLNNAAKYTPAGGRIWLAVESDGREVVFRVKDNGIGIPADKLAEVFDLFTQVDSSLDRTQGGLGIGLTLVRQLVEMHGGTVQAFSSGQGQGSEFVVRLPALVDGAAASDERSEASSARTGRPSPLTSHYPLVAQPAHLSAQRVLVVDDNVDVADTMAVLLRLAGHDVRIANDGPGAITQAATFLPDVVFLDIGLPKMNGYEVARRIKRIAAGAACRPGQEAEKSESRRDWKPLLVALSGYGTDDDVRRSREAGFDHHLVKPASFEAITAIFEALSRSECPVPALG